MTVSNFQEVSLASEIIMIVGNFQEVHQLRR